MIHPAMQFLHPMSQAEDYQLEDAVDALTQEAAYANKFGEGIEQRLMRIEALALLSHEFRRRSQA